MRQLLEFQPENIEPVEFTHFDMWFEEDDLMWVGVSDEAVKEKAKLIVEGWEETLKVKLMPDSGVFCILPNVAAFFDIIIVQLLEYGFDVYKGSTFIEIYKGE